MNRPLYQSLPFWFGLMGLVFLIWAWGSPFCSLAMKGGPNLWVLASENFGLSLSRYRDPGSLPIGGQKFVFGSQYSPTDGNRFFRPLISGATSTALPRLWMVHVPYGCLVLVYFGGWMGIWALWRVRQARVKREMKVVDES